MKINLKNILVLNLILLFVGSVIIKGETDDKSKSYKIGNNGKLNININTGDITIKSWERDEVVIRAGSKDELNALKINQTGNEIQINSGSSRVPYSSTDLQISVPANIELDIKTSYGDINIDGNINGKIICSTMGGDINTKNVTGNINLKTMGGDIHLGDINGESIISTLGGDIITGKLSGKGNIITQGGDIHIKESADDLILKTHGGDIETGNIGGSANFVTHGGDINTRYLNGDAVLTTYGGSIYILGSKNGLNVKTNGGSLNLKNVTGNVTANTAAGDIYLEFDPSKNGTSNILSNNGTITLLLPSSAKINIEFNLNTWGKLNLDDVKNYIKSEFPSITIETKNNRVDGKLILNSGGESLLIKGSNSKLIIKQLKR